jgi:hypothetical protein
MASPDRNADCAECEVDRAKIFASLADLARAASARANARS